MKNDDRAGTIVDGLLKRALAILAKNDASVAELEHVRKLAADLRIDLNALKAEAHSGGRSKAPFPTDEEVRDVGLNA